MQFQPLKRSETPDIFNDYLHNPEKIRAFYPHHFTGNWAKVIDERSHFTIPRAELVAALRNQHSRWNTGKATLQHIEKLADSNTFAVVTGQQAGVLGGPLYTFFKTMTVINLAKQLQQQFPEKQFVPVFWLEVNDSDFAEIAKTHYLTKENELKTLQLDESPDEADKPIAARKISDAVAKWREIADADFFDTEFKSAALDAFIGSYKSGRGYADAFADLLLTFFGEHGLVLFDPSGSGVCRLAQPLFEKALTNADKILNVANQRNNELSDAGYGTQIHFNPNQTLLFLNDKNARRVRVDIDDSGQFLLKYPDGHRPVAREDLLKTCSDSPQYLSPNVALRPLMQDSLLPTVAYVGGPSEVAYFAQVAALYSHFEIPMPVIFPRHRLTIVEGKIQKQIDKNELDFAEILENRPDFIDTVIRNGAGQQLFNSVESTSKTISDTLNALHSQLEAVDPTLVNSLEKTRDSIEGNFEKLSGKIVRSLEQRNETLVRQLEKIQLNLLPGGNYQERVLSMLYFIVKYGPDFVENLLENLPEDPSPHYIVKL